MVVLSFCGTLWSNMPLLSKPSLRSDSRAQQLTSQKNGVFFLAAFFFFGFQSSYAMKISYIGPENLSVESSPASKPAPDENPDSEDLFVQNEVVRLGVREVLKGACANGKNVLVADKGDDNWEALRPVRMGNPKNLSPIDLAVTACGEKIREITPVFNFAKSEPNDKPVSQFSRDSSEQSKIKSQATAIVAQPEPPRMDLSCQSLLETPISCAEYAYRVIAKKPVANPSSK